MGATVLNHARMSAAVNALANRFGEHTGRCAVCRRPVRLMVLTGLVPPHASGRPGRGCAGGEQRPGGTP